MNVIVDVSQLIDFIENKGSYPVVVMIGGKAGKVAGIAADERELAGAASKLLETDDFAPEKKQRLSDFAQAWEGGGGGFSGGGASGSW
ncbi:hypothetical protein GOL69_18000 [Sinorhizobium medicae]|nr:hypothetical protein [Sinorhizobium meliloti]MDX0587043.1 hypothetical protein [Sinorhizobium medicae]MDX1039151.1 hypothetical protein [Sinorhizobium medicae]